MTENTPSLNFDDIANVLLRLGAHASPAEVHGYIAGLLATGKRLTDKQWIEEAQVLIDADNAFSQEDETVLLCIYANTLNALADEDFIFYPLLPDDSQAINERLESLAAWCQSFMVGFALVKKAVDSLSDTVNDALHDMVAISHVDTDFDVQTNDSANEDYIQLVEYIRLASMSIFAEYNENASAPPAIEESAMSIQNLFKQRQLH